MVGGIKRVCDRIKDDKNGYWLAVGDLIENSVITSVGSIFEQNATPHEQINTVVDLLAPIADKCLGVTSGNHSARTKKIVGIDPDQLIVELLSGRKKAADIPNFKDKYFGYSVQGVIKVGKGQYRIMAHHTTGGGTTAGGKVNALVKLRNVINNAHIYIGAHTHADIAVTEPTFEISNCSGGCVISKYDQHFTGSGSTLDYARSYAHGKGYKPAATCQVVLHLGDRIHGGQVGKGRGEWSLPYDREVIRL